MNTKTDDQLTDPAVAMAAALKKNAESDPYIIGNVDHDEDGDEIRPVKD